MEQIAKDIRTREIAYEGIFRYDGSTPTNIYSTDYDDGISGYERELALREIDTHNPSIYYYFYDGLLGLSPTPLCVPDDTEKQKGLYKFSQIQIGDTIYCQKLLALEKVTVESAGFFISPSSDPFTNLDVNNQPRVTFYLKIADTLSPGAGKNVISFQTTVSQRVYKR